MSIEVEGEARQRVVAVLGAGIMGRALALRLVDCGHRVRLFNRRPEAAYSLVCDNLSAHASARDAVGGADVVLSALSNDAASEAVFFGPGGAADALGSRAIGLEMSTLSAAYVDRWARALRGRDIRAFDCPVTGSRAAAREGTLSLFIGAKEGELADAAALLAQISAQRFWFDQVGMGMRFKLAYNALAGGILVAFAEALELSARSGLGLDQVVDVLGQNENGWSAAVARSRGAAMVNRNHTDVKCAVDTLAKDLRYALAGAESELPVLSASLRTLQRTSAAGMGSLDMSAVRDTIIRREDSI